LSSVVFKLASRLRRRVTMSYVLAPLRSRCGTVRHVEDRSTLEPGFTTGISTRAPKIRGGVHCQPIGLFPPLNSVSALRRGCTYCPFIRLWWPRSHNRSKLVNPNTRTPDHTIYQRWHPRGRNLFVTSFKTSITPRSTNRPNSRLPAKRLEILLSNSHRQVLRLRLTLILPTSRPS
jgi:hypothetical protein